MQHLSKWLAVFKLRWLLAFNRVTLNNRRRPIPGIFPDHAKIGIHWLDSPARVVSPAYPRFSDDGNHLFTSKWPTVETPPPPRLLMREKQVYPSIRPMSNTHKVSVATWRCAVKINYSWGSRTDAEFLPLFFFKQKTAYEISACLVGSEMCIRDRQSIVHQKGKEYTYSFATSHRTLWRPCGLFQSAAPGANLIR